MTSEAEDARANSVILGVRAQGRNHLARRRQCGRRRLHRNASAGSAIRNRTSSRFGLAFSNRHDPIGQSFWFIREKRDEFSHSENDEWPLYSASRPAKQAFGWCRPAVQTKRAGTGRNRPCSSIERHKRRVYTQLPAASLVPEIPDEPSFSPGLRLCSRLDGVWRPPPPRSRTCSEAIGAALAGRNCQSWVPC